MFAIEVTDGLRKLFIPQRRFEELFYSSTGGCGKLFFFNRQFAGIFLFFDKPPLRKLWCMELDFLIFLTVFIHEVCDKISNRNIPNPNEHSRQLLARLWDAAKWRGDGKYYCSCTQCRVFKRRKILIAIATKHCRENGHVEGGMNIVHL